MISNLVKLSVIAIATLFVINGCAVLSGAGTVQYEADIDEMREGSLEAIEEMGMSVQDVRENIRGGYIIVGEREEVIATGQAEEGGEAVPEIVRLEIEIQSGDDGMVYVSASSPSGAAYGGAGTSDQDLGSQFFSNLEQLSFQPVEE